MAQSGGTEKCFFSPTKTLGMIGYDDKLKASNKDNVNYDFSILFLSTSLTFSSSIAPICLPASTQSLYTGQVATVTGWGDTSSDGSPASTLQEVQMTVMSNEECDTYYPGKIERYQDNFHQ